MYDPIDRSYVDEKSVRDELTRVFDTCQSCRQCLDLCEVFPTLFDLLDAQAEPDAAQLAPVEQDRVVDACIHCRRCEVSCPYTPDRHELAVHVPDLMLRATGMRRATGPQSVAQRRTIRAFGRVDGLARVAMAGRPTRAIANAKATSWRRRFASLLTGVTRTRRLPRLADRRLSGAVASSPAASRGAVVVPTCIVEYSAHGLSADLVAVLERCGVDCSVSAAGCCGAPSWHAGDVDRTTEIATRHLDVLADEARHIEGAVIVAQPVCLTMLREVYPSIRPGPDAELIAARAQSPSEVLVALPRPTPVVADADATGPVHVAYHATGHVQAQGAVDPGRELIERTGAEVTVVDASAGVESLWGLRAGHDDHAVWHSDRLRRQLDTADADIVATDCHLAATVIGERTGVVAHHPVQLLARAMGIPPSE